MSPDSWELQQNFPLTDFSTMERRRTQVLLMESRIQRFYKASNFSTDWSITTEKWCLPMLFPDCNIHFLKYTQELQQTVFKFNNIEAMPVRPQPAADRSSHSNYELDSHCHHSKLSYNLAIYGMPNSMAWASGTDVINDLLAKPFYKQQEPLRLDHTEFRTHFTWQLATVGGSPATVILELVYASAKDRLFGRSPTEVTLSMRLFANSTQLAINHAEGLIEYLRYDAPSRFSTVAEVCAAFFVSVIVAVLFGFAYKRYACGHCCARKADQGDVEMDDIHLYQCVDQPAFFRCPNVL